MSDDLRKQIARAAQYAPHAPDDDPWLTVADAVLAVVQPVIEQAERERDEAQRAHDALETAWSESDWIERAEQVAQDTDEYEQALAELLATVKFMGGIRHPDLVAAVERAERAIGVVGVPWYEIVRRAGEGTSKRPPRLSDEEHAARRYPLDLGTSEEEQTDE